MTNPYVKHTTTLNTPPPLLRGGGVKFGAGAKFCFFGIKSLAPAQNFIKGGGGDVKGCMLNTGVGHSASASYSLLNLKSEILNNI